MTGGSLGLRTSSYGSLQQNLQNSVVLPLYSTPITIRKLPKMPILGSREKEKFLPRICKIVSRKRVGMFLLAVVSVAVFLSLLSAANKDKDVSEGPRTNLSSLDARNYFGNDGRDKSPFFKPSQIREEDSNKLNEISLAEHQSVSVLNESKPLNLVTHASPFPSRHPCESFSLPPTPADRKRTGPRPCPVCYVPVEHAVALMPTSPSLSPVLKNLTYISEENSIANESNSGSAFGGHPSLQQRNVSYDIKESMTVHCGFAKGNRPGNGTGFDIDDADLLEMEQCHGIVVASAIFGNYDIMQQPKNISEVAKRSVCFYMFVDEETEAYIKNSSTLDSSKRVGLWRVVVVRSLPFVDARRNGKVPKLLLHRIFPNARFSLWIDGKLELVVDPYQILERFLWRRNATFAISRHYRRFDVYEEAEANKAAAKYDNASIDYQIEFYKNEGLTRYSPAKLPITSDVPEGCVIIREHTPITNLFTCLWFNEVDRFTSRDQISFSTVRDKIMSRVNWSVDMFLDCERRNFVVQAYHRDLLEHMSPAASMGGHHHTSHPPPTVLNNKASRKPSPEMVADKAARTPAKKPPVKRGRDRRSGSRRHRPRAATSGRDNSSI